MENLSKQETDLQLVNNVKNRVRDNDSLKELVKRHGPIFFKIKQKFASGSDKEHFLEDLSLNIDLIFYNACIKFDESRQCKFTSMLTNEIRWMFLNAWKKHRSRTHKLDSFESISNHQKEYGKKTTETQVVLEEPFCDPEIPNNDEENRQKILSRFYESLAIHSDHRVRDIFKMRYSQGKKLTPWRVIAGKMGLTTPGCIYIHDKHIKEVNSILEKEQVLC